MDHWWLRFRGPIVVRRGKRLPRNAAFLLLSATRSAPDPAGAQAHPPPPGLQGEARVPRPPGLQSRALATTGSRGTSQQESGFPEVEAALALSLPNPPPHPVP